MDFDLDCKDLIVDWIPRVQLPAAIVGTGRAEVGMRHWPHLPEESSNSSSSGMRGLPLALLYHFPVIDNKPQASTFPYFQTKLQSPS